MYKIAIISDIHANLPALEAVLSDIDTVFKADEIFCLGDLTDGAPWVNEVIDLIRAKNIQTVMGNHDERIAFNHEVYALKKHTLEEQEARFETIEQTKKVISHANRKYLWELHQHISFKAGGLSFLLVHGSPTSNRTYLYEDHSRESVEEMFTSTGADVIVCGHTHLSYSRSFYVEGDEKLLLNAGSVGRSKEPIGGKAVYLQLTINEEGESLQDKLTVSFRKIDYDVQKTIEAIRNSDTPNFYADFWEKAIQSL